MYIQSPCVCRSIYVTPVPFLFYSDDALYARSLTAPYIYIYVYIYICIQIQIQIQIDRQIDIDICTPTQIYIFILLYIQSPCVCRSICVTPFRLIVCSDDALYARSLTRPLPAIPGPPRRLQEHHGAVGAGPKR